MIQVLQFVSYSQLCHYYLKSLIHLIALNVSVSVVIVIIVVIVVIVANVVIVVIVVIVTLKSKV